MDVLIVIPVKDNQKASILNFEKFTLDIRSLTDKNDKDITLKSKDFSIDQLFFPPDHYPENIKKRFFSEGHQNISSGLNPIVYVPVFLS